MRDAKTLKMQYEVVKAQYAGMEPGARRDEILSKLVYLNGEWGLQLRYEKSHPQRKGTEQC